MKKKIQIAIKGPDVAEKVWVDVDAETVGPLAVHECYREPGWWTISHIATGLAVKNRVPSRDEALKIARRAIKNRGIWDNLDINSDRDRLRGLSAWMRQCVNDVRNRRA